MQTIAERTILPAERILIAYHAAHVTIDAPRAIREKGQPARTRTEQANRPQIADG